MQHMYIIAWQTYMQSQMSCRGSGPTDVHAGGLQMGSVAGSKLTTWRGKAEKACPSREAAIYNLVKLLKDCFTFPGKRPSMTDVIDRLKKI